MTGEELQRRRKAMNMSRAEFSRRIAVPYNTVWRWEAGRSKISYPRLVEAALCQLESETMRKIRPQVIFNLGTNTTGGAPMRYEYGGQEEGEHEQA